jgi:hypothetical protein
MVSNEYYLKLPTIEEIKNTVFNFSHDINGKSVNISDEQAHLIRKGIVNTFNEWVGDYITGLISDGEIDE